MTKDWLNQAPHTLVTFGNEVHTNPNNRTPFIAPLNSVALQFLLVVQCWGSPDYTQPFDTRLGQKSIEILSEIVNTNGNVNQKSLFITSVEKVKNVITLSTRAGADKGSLNRDALSTLPNPL